MAIKTRYCPHEPHTRTYRRSRSSRFRCCEACFLDLIEQELIETQGPEFVARLKSIKSLDMSKAWGKVEV